MTKDEIIKGALEAAEASNHKGTILATADGNVFLQKNKKDINGCVLHVRGTGKEQSIYLIDNSGTKATCKIISLKELVAGAYVDAKAEASASDKVNAKEEADKAAAKAKEEDDKAAAKAKEEADKAAGNTNPDAAQTDKLKHLEVQYSEMTNAELKELCEERKIEYGKSKKKQEFIDLLLAADSKITE